ncbi:hypothetical protein DYB31_015760 [Aphanomyces astaci]|uniref:Uncharacterized protein n=1 Tax=Aphanomyces astaci TaxID=112090 RepID=A0A397EJW1_APHAT|nr:hypothetical protein DYB31_015760 [Aphanomyces astaci]
MSVSVHQPPPKYPTLDWGTSIQVPAFSDVVAQGGGSNSSSSSTFKRARSEHNLDDMTSLSFPSSPTNSLRGLDECTLPAATVEVASLMLDDSAIAALSDVELGALSEQLIEDVVKQLVALAGTSPELLEEVSYIQSYF